MSCFVFTLFLLNQKIAVVSYVTGKVAVEKDGKLEEIKVNDFVRSGEKLKLQKDSEIILKLEDGSEIQIFGEADISLSEE